MPIATINPATGETLKSFSALSPDEITTKIENARAAFANYRHTTLEQRAQWLSAAADLLDADVDSIAELMTTEMGKTLAAAKAEVGKCAKGCRYYAAQSATILADVPADAGAVGARSAYTLWQPIGVVLAIMPWNFPLWQCFRFAAPALMAGNVGVLKHASNVPQTALLIEDVLRRAGFPDGVFQTLLVSSEEMEAVVADPRIAAVTLTGSEAAGRAVAAIAGRELKKTVLELGGSDPFVVMPSADLERAAAIAVTARTQNNGQSCIAAKRFIVHAEVAHEFTALFVEKMLALTVGDPMNGQTDIGPLATEKTREDVEELVLDARRHGASVLCGGERPAGPGWFYPPTVVAGVTPAMRMHREEVFGPVASLYVVPDLEAAIELANDSPYGLGSNAWTEDAAEQQRFIDELAAGQVFINGMTTSYNELPFGGIKASGYGREL
ncbi:MAG: NADP-dependent succinic semialdehyde dehydrogenase, partial [Frankiales bacterium]|nr:NADP-dependent succinic semialdehyde dehydrogenase [Frankiales bacterium]